jgi:hypothetical protein
MSQPAGFPVLDDAAAAASGPGAGSVSGRLLAWFGGAREAILRLCPGERSLYAGLGMGVLLTAAFGGASAAFAVSYVLHDPVRQPTLAPSTAGKAAPSRTSMPPSPPARAGPPGRPRSLSWRHGRRACAPQCGWSGWPSSWWT